MSRVLRYIRENNNPYKGIEKNYVYNIKRDLGLTKPTVIAAIDWLEEHGLVKRIQEGQKKKVVPNDERINLDHRTLQEAISLLENLKEKSELDANDDAVWR